MEIKYCIVKKQRKTTVNTYHATLDKGNPRTVENNFAALSWKPIVELKHLKASTLPILAFSENLADIM